MSFFTISRLLELNLVIDVNDVRHNPRKKKPSRKTSVSDMASMGSNHSHTTTMSRIFRRKPSKPDPDPAPFLAGPAGRPSRRSASTSPRLLPAARSQAYHQDHLITPSSDRHYAGQSGDGSGLASSRRSSQTSIASPAQPPSSDRKLHLPTPSTHSLLSNYTLSVNPLHPSLTQHSPFSRPVLGLLLVLLHPSPGNRASIERTDLFESPPFTAISQPQSQLFGTVRRYSSQLSFASSHSSQHSLQRASPRSSRRPSAPTIATKSAIAPTNTPPLPAIANLGSSTASKLVLQLPPFQIAPLEQDDDQKLPRFKDDLDLPEQKDASDECCQRDLNDGCTKDAVNRDGFLEFDTKHLDLKPLQYHRMPQIIHSNSHGPATISQLLLKDVLPADVSQFSPTSVYSSQTISPTTEEHPPQTASAPPPSPHLFGSFTRKPHQRLGARTSIPPQVRDPASDQAPWLVAGKVVPRFRLHLSKAFLNLDKLSPSMASPEAQIQRFNTFMDSLLGLQWNDPVIFANGRLLSLMKFTMRHKDAKALGENISNRNQFYCEGILSYEIINMRIFMRDMMMHASRTLTRRSSIAEDRELMQLNFVNYLAYLLQLPGELDPNQHYDPWLTKHYAHRNIFLEIADSLYSLEPSDQTTVQPSNQDRTNAEAAERNAANTGMSRISPLLNAISKVAYEYNLLETYQIQILAKFNRNLLLESELLRALFDTHKQYIDQKVATLPKVLVFNITHSLQYIWYMCLTTPFVRVIELSILHEDELLANDIEAYRAQEAVTPKHDFAPSDRELYDSLFLKLFLGSFEEYSGMSARKLVLLHRHLDNKLAKYATVNIHEVPSPSLTFSHKPMNAGFFDKPLAAIATNTFDAIQTRDPVFQLTLHNYKNIIGQFYRILKPGGVLEAPLMQAGIDKLKKNIEKELVASRVYQPNANSGKQWLGGDPEKVLKYFDLISDFPEKFLKELHAVFGPDNVRYNIVLLNSCNDVNDFLFKLNTLNLSAILGHFDEYCNELKAEMSSDLHKRALPESGLQYYVHIKAQKPLV